jgi:HTH-type transcriptional regulator / antitoxin HigA
MPITYEELLKETLPTRIDTDADYARIHARFGELFSKSRLTSAEEKLMNLLGILIREYDQRDPLPREGCSPSEMLQFLVDQSGQSAAALLTPIFGQRSHVYEALSGKRPISGPQAKKLGERFHVNPGIFL